MALITCQECGGQMSDRATECPHCGCPIEYQTVNSSSPQLGQSTSPKPRKSRRGLWIALSVFGIIAVITGGFFLFGNNIFGKSTLKITPEFAKALERYDQIDAFSDGLAAVCRDGKWGYINLQGEEVIPCQFSDDFPPGQFSEGLACVVDDRNEADKNLWNKRVGFINNKGEWVLTGDYFTESPSMGTIWGDVSHKLPSFKDGECAVWSNATHEAFDDNNIIVVVNTKGNVHEVSDSIGYKMMQYHPFPCPVPYKDIASNSEKKIVYDDYAITIARDTVECDNGARLVTWQILDANNYPYQTEEKTIQYFIDKHGNSTLTSTKQEAMEQHLNSLMTSLLNKHNEQLEKEAEKQRREALVGPDWLQGNWVTTTEYGDKVYVNINDGYMMVDFANGSIRQNCYYTITDGIVDGGSHQPKFRINWVQQCLETYDGRPMSRVSSFPSSTSNYNSSIQTTNTYNTSNSRESRWRNQLNKLTDEHNSLLDEFRTYQHRGQLDPMNAMWYKQRLLAIKDEQIGLAQNLGDYDLVREYQQKKLQLQQIFRSMGL